MRDQLGNKNPEGEPLREKRTGYLTCPVNLSQDFKQVAKMRVFLSSYEAIRQAITDFPQNHNLENVDAARSTEMSVITMVQMRGICPNLPSMRTAIRAESGNKEILERVKARSES